MSIVAIKIALGLCGALNLAAALVSRRFRRLAEALVFAAWLVALGVFAANCAMARAPAFGNMFHVMAFMPVALPLLHVCVRKIPGPGGLPAHFAALAALVCAGALFMNVDADWRRMPALQSHWFVPHVLSYLLAYALLAVATALAVFSGKTRAAQTDAMARMGFAFLTLGLCTGALWARQAWGRFWSWDIKESWALITWMLYLVYFHLKPGTRLGRAGRICLVVAFLALLFTLFAVNYLPRLESLHSYAS
jgi:ABC-type transport system involved in cytochrome c biogenesis permease subunit